MLYIRCSDKKNQFEFCLCLTMILLILFYFLYTIRYILKLYIRVLKAQKTPKLGSLLLLHDKI